MEERMVDVGFVSSVVKAMIDKVRSYMESEYFRQRDVEVYLNKLEEDLMQIQVMLTAAQEEQIGDDPYLAGWLRQVRDAVYDADDVLDEFEYRRLQARAKRGGSRVSRIFSSSLDFGNWLIGVDDFRTTLKNMLHMLDGIAARADEYFRLTGLNRATIVPPHELEIRDDYSRFLIDDYIIGREEEKNKLVRMLLEPVEGPESSNIKHIPVIAILGVVGVGKTSLAMHVYNERQIADHFEIRMWVHVSATFNMVRLIRNILVLASHGEETYRDIKSLDVLQQLVQTKLESKRFLLVLNDVWPNEEWDELLNREWCKKLLDLLKVGASSSKILVTTSMRMMAEMFGAMELVPLDGLSDDETWSLLKTTAFGNEIPNNYRELEEIGQRIAKRLNGVPLTIKVVGSMLRFRLDAEIWSEVLDRTIFSDVMSFVKLSYQHLPNYLKPCFAYCSIFPKNWWFEPKKLVLLWIAQGFIHRRIGNETHMMDIGMAYFNELFSRSFFEKVEQHYVMHDLMHDLAEYVSQDECFRMYGGKSRTITKTIRHVGVAVDNEDELKDILAQLKTMIKLKDLRTLIFFTTPWQSSWTEVPLGMFEKSRSLRVLDFGQLNWSGNFRVLAHLLHLRWLNLGANVFDVLPKSLCGLYHLQALVASKCLQLSKDLFKLFEFGKLACLHVPRLEFQVEKERGGGIGVLKGMTVVLQGELCIKSLENVTSKTEAIEADLGSKHLYGLELEWGSSGGINRHDADEEIADALKPSQNLKRLRIRGFQGIRFPSWLERNWLVNLEDLFLSDCCYSEVLPSLQHLPLLKGLEVTQCPKLMSFPLFSHTLQHIVIDGTGLISHLNLEPRSLPPSLPPQCFSLCTSDISSLTVLLHDHHLRASEVLQIMACNEPMPARGLLGLATLKKLEIDGCTELLKSEEDGGGVLPSSLELLEIYNCPVTDRWLSRCLQGGLTLLSELQLESCTGLTSLPSAQVLHCLTALRELRIWNCKGLTSLGGLDALASLTVLRISGCEQLTSLEGLHALVSLKELLITDCDQLTSLGCLHALTSLKRLTLWDCRKVESLSEKRLPSSIEYLCLRDCHPALMQRIRRKKGRDWDKVAHIPCVDI